MEIPTMARIEAQTVKLYPELCAASLKAGIDKELALWYELRAIDTEGSSRLDIDAVLARLVPMAYSKATLYRILSCGAGRFWSIYTVAKPYTHFKVQIVGILNIARFLDVSHISRPREVSLASFIGRKAKRAQLYSSFHKPAGFRKTKPISRASLELATGVSRRSQLRYDKVAGTKKVANFGFQDDGKGGVCPILEFLKGKKRQYLTVRRLGNIYHSQAVFAASGMAKRVNNQLRERSLEDEGVLPQRFFLSAKSLLKSKHRHTEAFLLAPPGRRVIRGRLEWCLA
jgi:hypothetical protein